MGPRHALLPSESISRSRRLPDQARRNPPGGTHLSASQPRTLILPGSGADTASLRSRWLRDRAEITRRHSSRPQADGQPIASLISPVFPLPISGAGSWPPGQPLSDRHGNGIVHGVVSGSATIAAVARPCPCSLRRVLHLHFRLQIPKESGQNPSQCQQPTDIGLLPAPFSQGCQRAAPPRFSSRSSSVDRFGRVEIICRIIGTQWEKVTFSCATSTPAAKFADPVGFKRKCDIGNDHRAIIRYQPSVTTTSASNTAKLTRARADKRMASVVSEIVSSEIENAGQRV